MSTNEDEGNYLKLNSENESNSRNKSRNETLIQIVSQKTKISNISLGILNKASTSDKFNLRKDIFGNEIKKGGKQKVSFIDNPILKKEIIENQNENENNKDDNKKRSNFAEILEVESYKKYNKIMAYDYKDEFISDTNCCTCCFIF